MAILELSGATSGVGILYAVLSSRYALAGTAAGKGTLGYGSQAPRVFMDVEGYLGEMPYTDSDGVWVPADSSSIQDGQVPVWDESSNSFVFRSIGAASIPNDVRDAWVPLIIGDGVNPISAGLYPAAFYLPKGEILNVKLWGKEASGSIDADLWADIFANVPPTVADSITNSNHLVISAARKVEKTQANLATDGWIVTVPTGGYFGYVNLVSVSTFTQLFLLIQVRRG